MENLEIIVTVATAVGACFAAIFTGMLQKTTQIRDEKISNLENNAMPLVIEDLSILQDLLKDINAKLENNQDIADDLKYVKSFCYKNLDSLEEANKRLEEANKISEKIKDLLGKKNNL